MSQQHVMHVMHAVMDIFWTFDHTQKSLITFLVGNFIGFKIGIDHFSPRIHRKWVILKNKNKFAIRVNSYRCVFSVFAGKIKLLNSTPVVIPQSLKPFSVCLTPTYILCQEYYSYLQHKYVKMNRKKFLYRFYCLIWRVPDLRNPAIPTHYTRH